MNFLAGILDFAANEKDFHPESPQPVKRQKSALNHIMEYGSRAKISWAVESIVKQNLTISAIPQLLKTSQGLPDER